MSYLEGFISGMLTICVVWLNTSSDNLMLNWVDIAWQIQKETKYTHCFMGKQLLNQNCCH